MTIFTIGFTKKSAQTFFELFKSNGIEMLIDIRLNNSSQLSGFSKGSDLEYFLKEICRCAYAYEAIFAPTKELMDDHRAKKIPTEHFEASFLELMRERNALTCFEKKYAKLDHICLLCSEDTPEACHRRVLAELLAQNYPGTKIVHL